MITIQEARRVMMTPQDIEAEFNVTAATVRQAKQNGYIPDDKWVRIDNRTFTVDRRFAKERWGNK